MSSSEGSANRGGSVIQRSASALSVGIGYGLVCGHDGAKPNMLDFGAKLGTNVGLVLADRTLGDVDDLGLAQVMHRSERSDRRRQLFAVAGQQALHLGTERLLLQRTKPGPFMA